MSEAEYVTRECPFCKEEVKAEAVRCKHCQASILPTEPGHKGICPFCKESINPQAIRCRHCKADLLSPLQSTGRYVRAKSRRVTRRQPGSPASLASAHCAGCAEYEIFDGVSYVLYDCDANWCYYADPDAA